jgi:hypothetical protein
MKLNVSLWVGSAKDCQITDKARRMLKKFVQQGPSNSLYLSLGERLRLPFTARIERAQFHRARSASKEGTWPTGGLFQHPAKRAVLVVEEGRRL